MNEYFEYVDHIGGFEISASQKGELNENKRDTV